MSRLLKLDRSFWRNNVADHLTEEEQVEAFKAWWKENWLSVILPIVLVAGGVIFWNSYQENRVAKAEAASDDFAEILALTNAQQNAQGFGAAEISAEDQQLATAKAEAIIAEYGGTRYAYLARLMLAKFEVEAGRYDSAAANLKAVVDGADDQALAELAQYRLAKVYMAQEKFDDALAIVNNDDGGEFAAAYAELKGDVFFAQGKIAEANTAYIAAREKLSTEQFSRRGIINMKVENTTSAESSDEPTVDAASAVEGAAAVE